MGSRSLPFCNLTRCSGISAWVHTDWGCWPSGFAGATKYEQVKKFKQNPLCEWISNVVSNVMFLVVYSLVECWKTIKRTCWSTSCMLTKRAETIKSQKNDDFPDHDAPWAFACFCGVLLAWSHLFLFIRWLWWLVQGCQCFLCFLGVWNIIKCQQYGNALWPMLLLFEPAMAFIDCPISPAALVRYWVMTPCRGCRLWICWRWGGHPGEFLKAKWPPFSLLSAFCLEDLLFCFSVFLLLTLFSIII